MPTTPVRKPSRIVESRPPLNDAPAELRAKNKRTLWWLVAGTTVVILILWFIVVGLHLSRTSTGDESLYARIKREISSVFNNGTSTNGALSNNELKNLEDRVFPNSNIQPSGTFTIE